MDDENRTNGNETGHQQRTPRARSRTVLLTSDMAGQVRSRLSAGGAARESAFTAEEPQTNNNSGFERREAPAAFERHGDVTTVTPRPSFQARAAVTEPQQSEEEEEIPSHLTRQRMEEAEREASREVPREAPISREAPREAPVSRDVPVSREAPVNNEWHTRSEVVEQPESDSYSTVERAIPTRFGSRAERPEPRAGVRSEPRPEAKPAPQKVEYVEDTNPGEDRIVWSKDGALIGFLISYDKNENGTVFELRAGRLIVTSEFAGTGNFLYLNDSTVSPMHAILRCSKGSPIQVLDQLSECGTKIVTKGNKDTKELAGDKGSLKHGDTVFFGERSFKVCLIDE